MPPTSLAKDYVNNVVVVLQGFDEEQQSQLQAHFLFPSSVLWTPLPSLPHAKHTLYHGAASPTQRDQFLIQLPDVLFRVGRPYIFIRL